MKKLILILIGTFSLGSLAAQTITSTWGPQFGNQILQIANPTSINIGPSGNEVTWNLSSAVVDSSTTIALLTPELASGSTNYPTASLSERNFYNGFERYVFYQANNAEFSELGYFTYMGGDSIYDVAVNSRKLFQFPMSFASTFTDDYSFQNRLNGNASTQTTGSVQAEVDGAGTLILPGGVSIADALRIKYIDNYSVSPTMPVPPPFPTGLRTTYIWVSPTYPGVILANFTIIDFDNQGAVSSFYYSVPANVGINDLDILEPTVYPSPASEKVMFNLINNEKVNSLIVYNELGQNIYMSNNIHLLANSLITVDISQWENGIYFYSVLFDKGRRVNGRFIKVD